jgi:hypothetical protein
VPLERIVATAARIVDEDGSDALSMRTLAQRLGSGTATLYGTSTTGRRWSPMSWTACSAPWS